MTLTFTQAHTRSGTTQATHIISVTPANALTIIQSYPTSLSLNNTQFHCHTSAQTHTNINAKQLTTSQTHTKTRHHTNTSIFIIAQIHTQFYYLKTHKLTITQTHCQTNTHSLSHKHTQTHYHFFCLTLSNSYMGSL